MLFRSETDILKLQKKFDAEAFVKETEYISKKQALEEQTAAMGTDPQEFLGYNPFTASIEIKLHSQYANADSIAMIEKSIKRNTNIQDILYQRELIDMVNDNIRNISLVLLALDFSSLFSSLFFFFLFLIIFTIFLLPLPSLLLSCLL